MTLEPSVCPKPSHSYGKRSSCHSTLSFKMCTFAHTISLQHSYQSIDNKSTTRRTIHQCIHRVRHGTAACYGHDGRSVLRKPRSRLARHRIRIRIKVYVTLFICLATKVVHLGAVSDLPTDAFIAKLERFVVKCVGNIYSYNGTNFVGTNIELLALCRKDN